MNEIKIASAVILSNNNELLLVRKKGSTYFQLTGGKINVDENESDTVIREVLEEVGLQLQASDLDFLGQHQTTAVNEKNTLVTGFIYQVTLQDNFIPKIANEIEEFAWLNSENYNKHKWAHLAEEFVLPICKKLWNIK